jgi:hypothetical protein
VHVVLDVGKRWDGKEDAIDELELRGGQRKVI